MRSLSLSSDPRAERDGERLRSLGRTSATGRAGFVIDAASASYPCARPDPGLLNVDCLPTSDSTSVSDAILVLTPSELAPATRAKGSELLLPDIVELGDFVA